jgi:hypothetical protein
MIFGLLLRKSFSLHMSKVLFAFIISLQEMLYFGFASKMIFRNLSEQILATYQREKYMFDHLVV